MRRPALLLAAIAWALPAAAADRDFTFRRVPAPEPGARISLVQIDPAEQARALAPPDPPPSAPLAAPPAEPARPGHAGGAFWDAVSPAGSGPGGLSAALSALSATGAAAPRLAGLQRIADRHGAEILRATVGTRVSPALVLAVIAVESGGRSGAVSPAGAEGLMQLMPATARRFGVADSLSPSQNIRGGVAYLDWLMRRFGEDPVLALAGYNAGEGAVDSHGGVPPFAETRGYVPKVLAAYRIARGLCATPPLLASDGCVFVGERMAGAG